MAGAGYDERLAAAAVELARLLRRLRSLSARATADRRVALSELIEALSALDVAVECGPSSALPEVPDHALADVVAVIGGDLLAALAASPEPDAVDRLIDALRAADSAVVRTTG